MKIVCIGNYLPRRCGIATFTHNLVNALQTASKRSKMDISIEVIVMNDDLKYEYPSEVVLTINEKDIKTYAEAVNYINQMNFDICIIQHEYGIYGGESGVLILQVIKNIRIPVITVLHSVLEKPNFHQREIINQLSEFSEKLIVMNTLAIDYLTSNYDVQSTRISVIRHGIPSFIDYLDKLNNKKGYKENKTILTFGLLGRNKGIEVVIKALPEVITKHPDVKYVIIGKTHPNVVKYNGEEYREYLEKLVIELNLTQNVKFINEYISEEDLIMQLLNADIYVTPYLNKAQITSGTLSYAVGAGLAVISTPYWHAEEILNDKRGILFDFGNYSQLTRIINHLLDNPEEMNMLRHNAFEYGLSQAWPSIGTEYLNLLSNIIQSPQKLKTKGLKIPDFDYSHLNCLTDSTGIIQHAIWSIPLYSSGYCLDDNARALILVTMAYNKFKHNELLILIHRFLSFVIMAQNDDGSFINYFTYSREKVDNIGSEDSSGRALWALGYLINNSPTEPIFHAALAAFNKSLPILTNHVHARGIANCIFGLYYYLKKFPDNDSIKLELNVLTQRICNLFNHNATANWYWFEENLTYDNGIIVASLFKSYEITGNEEVYEIGLKAMKFIESKCFIKGCLHPVGNKRWFKKTGNKVDFGQQPIDVLAIIIAYDSLFKITKDKNAADKLIISFEWFLGNNDLILPLIDYQSKGCCDGLEEYAVNRNQGAESTIAWLISWLIADNYINR